MRKSIFEWDRKMTEETTFEKLKKALEELRKGYPDYVFYGKIEFYLKSGKGGVEVLAKDGIIEKIPKKEVKKRIKEMTPEELQKLPQGEDRFRWYRLTAKGVDLTISMINLEHSEKISDYGEKVLKYNKEVSKYSQETSYFSKLIIWLTRLLVIIGFMTLIIGAISILPKIIRAFINLF